MRKFIIIFGVKESLGTKDVFHTCAYADKEVAYRAAYELWKMKPDIISGFVIYGIPVTSAFPSIQIADVKSEKYKMIGEIIGLAKALEKECKDYYLMPVNDVIDDLLSKSIDVLKGLRELYRIQLEKVIECDRNVSDSVKGLIG